MKSIVFAIVGALLALLGFESMSEKFSTVARASTKANPFEMSQPNQDRPDRKI